MSATMPAYQPMFSTCVCLRRSALSPVLEMKVSTAAILPSFGRVAAADLHRVVGLDQAPAGVGVARREGAAAGKLAADHHRRDLGLAVGREARLRHVAGDRGVADHVDVGVDRRLHVVRIDRAEAALVGEPGIARDLAGHLRRDHVDELGLVVGEIGLDRHRLGVDALDAAVHLRVLPFDHAGIVLLPALHEQRPAWRSSASDRGRRCAISCGPWP